MTENFTIHPITLPNGTQHKNRFSNHRGRNGHKRFTQKNIATLYKRWAEGELI